MTVRLQAEPFDAAAEAERLTHGRTDVGAVVTFTGLCRGIDTDGRVGAMTLEHYPGMADDEIARHVAEAERRWPLLGVTVIHRYGRLVPGDPIVLVATASAHRQAAFEAAEFLMDFLKTQAPFWKREERPDGAQWVEAKADDDAAVARWQPAPRRGEAAE
jgi:molybdopterin synthase catalytic subunit